MSEIFNLKEKHYKFIEYLTRKYGESLRGMGYPTLGRVAIRTKVQSAKDQSVMTTAVVAFEVTNKGHMRIGVFYEHSALLTRPVPDKNFEIVLDINEPKFKVLKQPQDMDILRFLDKEVDKEGHNNMQLLMSLYLSADFASAFLRFAMTKSVVNGATEWKPVDNFNEMAESVLVHAIKKHNREHLLDGWDVVAVTGNQLRKVGQTLAENKAEYDFDNNPLRKFCLQLYDGHTQYYFFNRIGNMLECGVYNEESAIGSKFKVSWEPCANKSLELSLDAPDEARAWCETQPEGAEVPNWQWCVDAFFAVNTFMLKFGDVTMEVETKEAVAPSKSKQNGKHQNRNSVRLFKTYKLIKGWKNKARKKAEITCVAWGVRGHLRHYKTGKVVFIESYVKGTERDKYKGKEYVLLPYKDA